MGDGEQKNFWVNARDGRTAMSAQAEDASAAVSASRVLYLKLGDAFFAI